MRKLFIRYLYHGLVVSDISEVEVRVHDLSEARRRVPAGRKPFGFQYIIRERGEHELDSKVTSTSGTRYFGGEVWTLEQIKARNNPRDEILISNMEGNGYEKIIMLGGQAMHFTPDAVLLEPLA